MQPDVRPAVSADSGANANLAAPAVAQLSGPAPRRNYLRMLAGSRPLTLFILVAALCTWMSIAYPKNFPTSSNVSAVLLNAAQNGILVTGMMLLMIGGTFDLSIGSILALSGVWAGVTVHLWGWPPILGVITGLGIGAVAGLINGLIVTRVGINALIATLATLSIFRGLTYVTAGTGVTPIGDDFKRIGQTVFFTLQTPFWVMLAVVVIGGWAIARTALPPTKSSPDPVSAFWLIHFSTRIPEHRSSTTVSTRSIWWWSATPRSIISATPRRSLGAMAPR